MEGAIKVRGSRDGTGFRTGFKKRECPGWGFQDGISKAGSQKRDRQDKDACRSRMPGEREYLGSPQNSWLAEGTRASDPF
jgi:hypothetical protein